MGALRRAMHGFVLMGSTGVVLLKDISVYRAETISFSCLCFDIGLPKDRGRLPRAAIGPEGSPGGYCWKHCGGRCTARACGVEGSGTIEGYQRLPSRNDLLLVPLFRHWPPKVLEGGHRRPLGLKAAQGGTVGSIAEGDAPFPWLRAQSSLSPGPLSPVLVPFPSSFSTFAAVNE